MRVPEPLANAFGIDFQNDLEKFVIEAKLMSPDLKIDSTRFLSRSVIPHVKKLSELFNRIEEDSQTQGLDPYWKESSNPAGLRLAYFLYFMPANLFRVSAVISELARLGYRWPTGRTLKAIEFGSGPASGTAGLAAGEAFSSIGIPRSGNFALIEQDKASLELGKEWAEFYLNRILPGDWSFRTFHRKIDFKEELLPKAAPKFNLWLMSFFLNESSLSPRELAKSLSQTWDRHLEEDGLVILVEPALKHQSRKILELRDELIKCEMQILTPCLGHQKCGALSNPEDWCHEVVTWWRPPYYRQIDKLAELDRKTLPFSYLVLTNSKKSREDLLPQIQSKSPESRVRLVSPAHKLGKDLEFYTCGVDGKRRVRAAKNDFERGDVLLDADLQGDANATRLKNYQPLPKSDS